MDTRLKTKRYNITDNNSILWKYAQKFISHFGTGKKSNNLQKLPLSGRVLRGINDADFNTLTDNPHRKIVFLIDEVALDELIGLDGNEILLHIGYEESFIHDLFVRGTKFKLVVLPKSQVKLATWDNLLDVVSGAYPAWSEKIEIARSALKSYSYDKVIANGSVVADVRRFLREEINLNRLFAGDGYTRIEGDESQKIYAEYVTLNKPLSDFGSYVLINFPVDK